MKRTKKTDKLQQEAVFLIGKLPTIKQMEALDFIKWLWINVELPKSNKNSLEKILEKIWDRVEKHPISEKEVDGIVEMARAERYAKSCR